MRHEIDWESLAELQFLLYSRIADSLNTALSGIALSDMPEAQDKPPGFWKERATIQVSNVLNLFTAWSNLIRFKLGETIPEHALRPFPANALLDWLGAQLQLSPVPHLPDNPALYANQETLQEAVLLLYSAAFTQGADVRLELEPDGDGIWFRVRFMRTRPMPETFDALLASFSDHWRDQVTHFELATARDFVALNGLELALNASDDQGEFAFLAPTTAAARAHLAPTPALRADTTPVILGNPERRKPAVSLSDPSTPALPDPPAIPSPVTLAEPDSTGTATVSIHSDDTQISVETLIIRRPPSPDSNESPSGSGQEASP